MLCNIVIRTFKLLFFASCFSFDVEIDTTDSEVTIVCDPSFIVENGEVSILNNNQDQDSDSSRGSSSESDDPSLYVVVCFCLFFSDTISLWLCL